jgi:zinc finger protein
MESKTFRLPDQPCPLCRQNSLQLTESMEQVDYFGPVLLTTISCSLCGYKDTDVALTSVKEPSVMRAHVNSDRDLTMKVVRSSSATIRVPELGVSITPRTSAQGYITNIEGILDRVQEVLQGILPTLSPGRRRRAELVLARLRKAREGKLSFTLEVKDPLGNSAIVGSDTTKIKRRPLSKKELEKLRDELMAVQRSRSLPETSTGR